MAAYHWEARRRQMAVERRLRQLQERDLSAEGWRQRQQQQQQQQEEVPRELKIRDTIPLPPNIVTQKTAPPDAKDDRCMCNTHHVPGHSGKLTKRHSSKEYTQQW